ncbi:unnamed protein product [Malus baccata var. baccata]
MQLRGKTTADSLLLTLTLLTTLTHAHNITRLFAKHSEFSTFNHYLTLTHLAADINERTIITKLHQITNGTALVATMFQATGNASGSFDLINITDLKGGKVSFTPMDNDDTIPSHFVKAVKEQTQVTSLLPAQNMSQSSTPAPAELNITGIMSGHGCKVFIDKLLANSDAFKTYDDNVDGGLTLFCLMDDAFKAFLPKFKNLTVAGKTTVLEYHGILVYQSMSMLRSNNGLMNILAIENASKFDFTIQNDGQQVTLKTKVVLQPKELFKGALTLALAPAPKKQARASKKLKNAPSPNAEEHTSDDNNAAVGVGRMGFDGLVFIVVSFCFYF